MALTFVRRTCSQLHVASSRSLLSPLGEEQWRSSSACGAQQHRRKHSVDTRSSAKSQRKVWGWLFFSSTQFVATFVECSVKVVDLKSLRVRLLLSHFPQQLFYALLSNIVETFMARDLLSRNGSLDELISLERHCHVFKKRHENVG